jgi:hypothetical protein
MKDGKDMKKIYTMYNDSNCYLIKNENSEIILSIKKTTLNVEGKELYEKIFKDFKKGDSIVLKKDKSIENDKFSISVYDNLKEIIENIVDSLSKVE